MRSLIERARRLATLEPAGTVVSAVGPVARARGILAVMGQPVYIWPRAGEAPIAAEVVGIDAGEYILVALGDFEGLGARSLVTTGTADPMAAVGCWMLGRVLDGLGRPLDGRPLPTASERRPLRASSPNPLERRPISDPFGTGVRAIDAITTMGKGQRVGVFAGAGVGKSTVLQMIARNARADVCVIALIGERGREVRDYIHEAMNGDARRTVIVACTGDAPPLMRVRASLLATTIAEYFRSQAADVLLLFDSLTRYAMALREVGLAAGELPSSKGYPPSVFHELSRIVERAGNDSRGTMTGVYSVLVEGDDLSDPVADSCRALLDGHIVLARDLANSGVFPAVDVLGSKSRLMDKVVGGEHLAAARRLTSLIATYRQAEDLVRIGAYQAGSDPEIDCARRLVPDFEEFITQAPREACDLAEAVNRLISLAGRHSPKGKRAA